MACPTNRCALRRFDGHGTNSYRPANPEAHRQFDSSLQGLIAQRELQDKGIFNSQATQMPQNQNISQTNTIQKYPVSQVQSQPFSDFAPLSDSKIK
jgi:hypothetical protein